MLTTIEILLLKHHMTHRRITAANTGEEHPLYKCPQAVATSAAALVQCFYLVRIDDFSYYTTLGGVNWLKVNGYVADPHRLPNQVTIE